MWVKGTLDIKRWSEGGGGRVLVRVVRVVRMVKLVRVIHQHSLVVPFSPGGYK